MIQGLLQAPLQARRLAIAQAPTEAARRMRLRLAPPPLAAAPLAALALALAAASCAEAPPGFAALTHRLIFAAAEAGQPTERLSVFASVTDGDGVEDIAAMYVVSDAAELSWTLDPDTWTRRDDGAAVWIGSNALEAQGGAIPRGSYRAIVVDKAGRRSETTFAVRAPAAPPFDPPSARIESGAVVVTSKYKVNTALFSDPGGNVVASVPIAPGRTALSALVTGGARLSAASHVSVYGYDPASETGGLSWKTPLSR